MDASLPFSPLSGPDSGADAGELPTQAKPVDAASPSPDGTDANSAPVPPREYCDAMTTVLRVRCGGGSCHSNPGATVGDFAIGQEEAEFFVNRDSVRNSACGLVIDSQTPAQSLILRKVTGDFPTTGCGAFMPVTGPDLTRQQIDCLADWLEQFGP